MSQGTRADPVFLSYARSEDGDFALDLASRLEKRGIELWIDQRDIPTGVRWDRELEAALDQARTVLVILSPAAVASENVLDEIAYALEEGKSVVPVICRACEVPMRLRRVQYLDLSGPNADVERLVGRLRQIASTPPPAAAAPAESSDLPSGEIAPTRRGPEPGLADVLRGLYRALGGENILRAISSVRSVGTAASSLGKLSITTTITKNPPRVRVEQRLGTLRVIQAFDGQTAWTWPIGGDRATRAAVWMGGNLIALTEIDTPLVDYRGKGHRVELLEQDREDGKPVYALRVEMSHGGEQLWFLDRDTYLPYKARGKALSAEGEVAGEAVYSDYRDVEGVQAFHRLRFRPLDGSPAVELTYSSIEFNVEVDPELFRMPEAESPPSTKKPAR